MSVLQHPPSWLFLVQLRYILSQCCFEQLVVPALYRYNNSHEPKRFLTSLESEYLHSIRIPINTLRTQSHIVSFNNIRNMNWNWCICPNSIFLHHTDQFTLCQIPFGLSHHILTYLELMSIPLCSHTYRFPKVLPISTIPQIWYFFELQSDSIIIVVLILIIFFIAFI